MRPEFFEGITIRGRFIYGYLCLHRALRRQEAPMLPGRLDALLHEFVTTHRLDLWHEKIGSLQPTTLLEEGNMPATWEEVRVLSYYRALPDCLVRMIDDLIELGMANLYSGFDSSRTLGPLESIMATLQGAGIPLPDPALVAGCRITGSDAWGRGAEHLGTFLLQEERGREG